jgi:hypothetical protein
MPTCRIRFLLTLGLLGATTPALGSNVGRTSFADKTAGIRIFLPPRWTIQLRSALPGLVATFRHPTGARLVLSARARRSDETVQQLAVWHLAPLRKQGWVATAPAATQLGPVPALLMEATDPTRKIRIYQVYAIREKLAYVLTLTVPEAHRGRLAGDLRFLTKTARFAR